MCSKDSAGVDTAVGHVMQRTADLWFAVEHCPEGRQHAAIIGQQAGMQIDDAKARDGNRRWLEYLTKADRDDDVGIECSNKPKTVTFVDRGKFSDGSAVAHFRELAE